MGATTNLVVTDELEAVNTMLRNIGEAPILDVEEPGLLQAVNALATLRRVSKSTQSKGWEFNTEWDVTLAVNGDSKIPVAANVLRIDSSNEDAYRRVTRRGAFLYDLDNQTYTHTSSMQIIQVLFLSFEDIPECARDYILVKAAREFMAQEIGADSRVFGFDERDEFEALSNLKDLEGWQGDHNVLTGSNDVFRTLDRSGRAGGGPVFDWLWNS